MSEQDLDELLTRIPVPSYDVRDDVERGQLALRRRAVGLSAAGLVLTATVGTALLFQGSWDGGTAPQVAGSSATPDAPTPSLESPAESFEPGPTISPSPPAPTPTDDFFVPEPRYGYGLLREWRDVLAEHLGDGVRFAQNQQGSGTAVGSKYDWNGGGMLQLMVGTRWNDIAGFVGLVPKPREPYRGLEARSWTDGSDLVVSVRHEDGTVVSLYATTSFGNNGTSTESLRLTTEDLLDAAADPRLRLPD